jgi:putative ABC transport system permease protein
MLLNYLKIAFRFLTKNRSFSIINIFGLTLGFLCFILIALYLHDELSFDMFHRDAGKMFRVLQHEKADDGSIRDVAPVAARIAPEGLKQIPGIESVCRISGFGRITVGNDPNNRNYERLITADPNFFSFLISSFSKVIRQRRWKSPKELLSRKNLPNDILATSRLWENGYGLR